LIEFEENTSTLTRKGKDGVPKVGCFIGRNNTKGRKDRYSKLRKERPVTRYLPLLGSSPRSFNPKKKPLPEVRGNAGKSKRRDTIALSGKKRTQRGKGGELALRKKNHFQ